MTDYNVKMVVEGKNTTVRVNAVDSSAAKQIALAQFSGSNAHVVETSKAK
jgi:hypothetical protein